MTPHASHVFDEHAARYDAERQVDCCASVEDQLAWLRAAGFDDVDCLFKDHRFAVLVAVRRS